MLTHQYHAPTKEINGIKIEKPFDEWTALEKELDELNSRACNTLHCALLLDDYMKISMLNSAKEIWDKLNITYEGTNEVRNAHINRLVHEYELFHMSPSESISDMYTRFMKIINMLHSLGRIYKNQDLVYKILRCLHKEWDAKVTVISEAKDLSTYPLDQLLGCLIAHEQVIAQRDKLDGSLKKKKEKGKTIALYIDDNDEPSSSSSNEDTDEVAMLTRRLGSLLRKKNQRYKKSKKYKFHTKKFPVGEGIICDHCKKPGHIRGDCLDRID
ncbi:hypothetical protein MA16_Dca011190 [Dendrobium catenatum]|uniref:CCHC-type domain-containing protein n=1 Tax=Dendrobium catenatum TaxID=906689 RepID=A0A2I0VII4_9ASPA|nr:hypothetical protein MA16_Dca011190 [Dendrobium catenatum]